MLNLKRSPSSWKLNSEAATSSPWKKLIVTLLFLGTVMMYGQPSIQWEKSLGGTGGDQGYSVQQTSDGGYIVAGSSSSTDGDVTGNHSGNDYWIVKLDNLGAIQWQKSLGGSGNENAHSIQQTADGGYIVAGWSGSNNGDVTGNHAGDDYWIVKLDNTGNIQWQKSLGGTGNDQAYFVQQTSDGGYIVAGNSTSNNGDITGNHGGNDYWIVKLDNLGTIQWQKSLGGTSTDQAYSVQQTIDGGYIVAGNSSSNNGDITGNHGGSDYWIVKLDNTGILQWQKSLGGTSTDQAYSIRQTTDGGYIVAGYSNSAVGVPPTSDRTVALTGTDYWIVKLDASGVLQWEKSLGGTSGEQGNFVQETTDGGYVVMGYSSSTNTDVTGNHGSSDYWIIKLDNTGTLQWQKALGGTLADQAWAIQQTADSGYIVAGYSFSNNGDVTGNHGGNDAWIVKLLDSNPLPISLLSFTGSCEAGAIVLKWSTATETNNDYFSIEKSTDAIHWQLVKKVQGAGNSSWTNNYELSLEESHGIKYYRLKQTDYNGHEELFPLIVVDCASNASYSVWPNPFSDELNVESSEEIGVIITDVVGRKVFQTTSIGHNVLHPELVSGIYFLSILAQDENQKTIKIIVKGWPLVFERLFLYRKFGN